MTPAPSTSSAPSASGAARSRSLPYLGIDTATPFLALALWSPERGVLARGEARVERDHAARIVPELEALFAAAGLVPRAGAGAPPPIAGIVVGTGPGSYTGLRVGAATARGLARGWGVPLAGADTLAALAARELDEDVDADAAPSEYVWGVIDARRGNVYAGRYRLGRAGIETLEPPAKRPRVDLPPNARIVEGAAPDAAALARTFGRGEAPTPRYL